MRWDWIEDPENMFVEYLHSRTLLAADFGWAITHGGGGFDRGSALAVDSGGNVITAGVYNGAVSMSGVTLPSRGTDAAFIAKYAASSSLKWAKGIGGSGAQNIQSVAVDPSGDVFAAGYFSGSIDLDPGSGVQTITSKGQHDAFLLKLDPNGNFLWAKQFGGTGDEGATALTVDSGGNAFILGMFTNPSDYNPGTGTATLTSHGSFDVFLTKLDPSGNFLFAKSVGGPNEDYANGIAINPAGDPTIVGTFNGSIDIDPSAAVANRSSAGGKDVFVIRLNKSNGALISAQTFGGTSDDQAGDIRVDRAGNIFVTGSFFGTGDFDPSSTVASLKSAGSSDVFVSKLSSSGGYVWAKRVGGTGADRGTDLATDSAGNVYVTGQFAGTADFDPGAGSAVRSASGSYNFFALKLSSAGSYVWAKTPTGGNPVNVGEGIGLDGSGHVYVAGAFAGVLDFDPGPGVVSRSASGKSDGFLWKLLQRSSVFP